MKGNMEEIKEDSPQIKEEKHKGNPLKIIIKYDNFTVTKFQKSSIYNLINKPTFRPKLSSFEEDRPQNMAKPPNKSIEGSRQIKTKRKGPL